METLPSVRNVFCFWISENIYVVLGWLSMLKKKIGLKCFDYFLNLLLHSQKFLRFYFSIKWRFFQTYFWSYSVIGRIRLKIGFQIFWSYLDLVIVGWVKIQRVLKITKRRVEGDYVVRWNKIWNKYWFLLRHRTKSYYSNFLICYIRMLIVITWTNPRNFFSVGY